MKIKSIKKINNNSLRYDIQTTSGNFYANNILVHNSMIHPIFLNGQLRLCTKAGITDISMMAETFISDKKNYHIFMNELEEKNLTPLFEYISKDNRVVINYPYENLILTAVRDKFTGKYKTLDELVNYETIYNIPLCYNDLDLRQFSLEDIVNKHKNLTEIEGSIIRFHDGHMLKIKTPWYIERHKAKDLINQEHDTVLLIVKNEIDDIKNSSFVSESDIKRIEELEIFVKNFIVKEVKRLDNLVHLIKEKYNFDKKSIALDENLSSEEKSFLFTYLKNDDIVNYITNKLIKICNKKSDYESWKDSIHAS